MVGSTVLAGCLAARWNHRHRDTARPYLSRLNHLTGHTVHLASLIDREAVYIDKYEGNTSIRMHSQIGKSVSLYASGVGKVILAYQPEPILSELIGGMGFQRHTAHTIAGEDALRR